MCVFILNCKTTKNLNRRWSDTLRRMLFMKCEYFLRVLNSFLIYSSRFSKSTKSILKTNGCMMLWCVFSHFLLQRPHYIKIFFCWVVVIVALVCLVFFFLSQEIVDFCHQNWCTYKKAYILLAKMVFYSYQSILLFNYSRW